MFVVSDEILERVLCYSCNKYMSAKPVKVYPNRGIKCGRCVNPSDAGADSLYGVLAENALFRCVNRFEGCNQLLTYDEVANHEAECVGSEYECQVCCSPFKGTLYDLFHHFKTKHEDLLLLTNPEITIDIEMELLKVHLYRLNDLLFYIYVRYNRNNTQLEFNISLLSKEKKLTNIRQEFILYSVDRVAKYKSKKRLCPTISGKTFKVDIREHDFPRHIIFCRFNLETEQAQQLIGLPVDAKLKGAVILENGETVDQKRDRIMKGAQLKAKQNGLPIATTSGHTFPPPLVTQGFPIVTTSGHAFSSPKLTQRTPIVTTSGCSFPSPTVTQGPPIFTSGRNCWSGMFSEEYGGKNPWFGFTPGSTHIQFTQGSGGGNSAFGQSTQGFGGSNSIFGSASTQGFGDKNSIFGSTPTQSTQGSGDGNVTIGQSTQGFGGKSFTFGSTSAQSKQGRKK